jgi:transcriptional regulator with XRE-family HTH domain
MQTCSMDGEIKKLRMYRKTELLINDEKRFIRMIKLYLAYYNISQRKLSKRIDVSHIVLNKVLNGNDKLVSIKQWDNTIEKLMKINLQAMFDDMVDEFQLEDETKRRLEIIDEKLEGLKTMKARLIKN